MTLWVRETFREREIGEGGHTERGGYVYRATENIDGLAEHWRPSIYMPRWASRIMLEITGIQVQRLQDISAEDCAAEGMSVPVDPRTTQILIDVSTKNGPSKFLTKGHFKRRRSRAWFTDIIRAHYASLWESINGADSWAANPWVWAVSFKRIEPT